MKYQKGQSGNPAGKKPGTKNKLPRDLALKCLAIAEELEKEQKGLQDCAKQNPQWFYENFVRPLLPKNIEASLDMGGELVIRWEQ